MTKDFSWDKSAGEYKHMYDDISDIDGDGDYISFDDAYDYLKHCYEVNDRENKEKYPEAIREDYHRVIQIQIVGRGEGFMNVEFKGREMIIKPEPRPDAEAFVVCSYDNLVAMARGLVTTDKLFLNGQLKLTGNLSKGFEIRKLLAPSK
jgi:putative sterol carrier protein